MKFDQNIINKNRRQVIFLFCPAHFPVNFAYHPWILINDRGRLDRWEVLSTKNKLKPDWGYVYKNNRGPFESISIFPYKIFKKYVWPKKTVKLIGIVNEDQIDRFDSLIKTIESSYNYYPNALNYRLAGPNSNTYIKWILKQFPEIKIRLPKNCVG